VLAVGSIESPFIAPRKEYISLKDMIKRVPLFGYQGYFNTEAAVKELEARPSLMLNVVFRSTKDAKDGAFNAAMTFGDNMLGHVKEPLKLSSLLSAEEFAVYEAAFQRSGFRRSLNYYRTNKINWEEERSLPINPKLTMPTFQLTCGHDPILPPIASMALEKHADTVTRTHIEEGNHWVLQEFPAQCLAALLPWLRTVAATSTSRAKL